MNPDCTIVLNTHERPRYIERAVRWYLQMDYPIIVADSSDTKWSGTERTNPAIRHIYRRGGLEVYVEKLRDALAEVHTPFVVMCDDDDFLLPEGISRSIDFLKTHPDYSFAQGYTYQFQPIGHHLALWPIPYRHDNPADTWIDRVERAVDYIVNYGVHRTPILRDALDFLSRQDFSEMMVAHPGFIDLGLASTTARRGKMKRVPVPSNMREYGGAAFSEGTLLATIVSHNVPDFYRNLLNFLLAGENSEAIRARLLRQFSRHYAGMLNYDLGTRHSKKRFVNALPCKIQLHLEYYFRLIQGVRGYATAYSLPLLKIYRMPVYRRFREFALLPGDRARS